MWVMYGIRKSLCKMYFLFFKSVVFVEFVLAYMVPKIMMTIMMKMMKLVILS